MMSMAIICSIRFCIKRSHTLSLAEETVGSLIFVHYQETRLIILAIVAIVLACLFAAFAFSAVQSQKTSGSNAMVKVEGMNTELDESDLTQYDGQILTGSQVVEAIKKLKDTEGVVVSTQDKNKHGYVKTDILFLKISLLRLL